MPDNDFMKLRKLPFRPEHATFPERFGDWGYCGRRIRAIRATQYLVMGTKGRYDTHVAVS